VKGADHVHSPTALSGFTGNASSAAASSSEKFLLPLAFGVKSYTSLQRLSHGDSLAATNCDARGR
jgi:hypothetical protein